MALNFRWCGLFCFCFWVLVFRRAIFVRLGGWSVCICKKVTVVAHLPRAVISDFEPCTTLELAKVSIRVDHCIIRRRCWFGCRPEYLSMNVLVRKRKWRFWHNWNFLCLKPQTTEWMVEESTELRPSRLEPYANSSEVDATSMFACGVMISGDMVVVVSACHCEGYKWRGNESSSWPVYLRSIHILDTHLRWDWVRPVKKNTEF
jgi:hypothetical protein